MTLKKESFPRCGSISVLKTNMEAGPFGIAGLLAAAFQLFFELVGGAGRYVVDESHEPSAAHVFFGSQAEDRKYIVMQHAKLQALAQFIFFKGSFFKKTSP
jgi:hypothetical protein